MLGQHASSERNPVDDDVSYTHDVLALQDGESEDQLDETLRAEARELGFEIPTTPEAPSSWREGKSQSSKTGSSDVPRRSTSCCSRATQSTGLTSHFSEASRDAQRTTPDGQRSRASLSLKDYDALVARGVSDGGTSISFSPPATPSQSAFSLPLSTPEASPKKHFRRIRGLSLLKLNRASSASSLHEGCPHCPRGSNDARRAVHKLPCGHRLCTQALRDTIKAASRREKGAVPCCCGRPIPAKLLEHVSTQEEQSDLLSRLERWDEVASIARARSDTEGRKSRTDSTLQPASPPSREELEKMLDVPDFRMFWASQEEQRDRFLGWVEKQRQVLQEQQSLLREQMQQRHNRELDELLEKHSEAVTDAEDKQVKAEAKMRVTHTQEKRDNATALKHMEAYCSGILSNGERHSRTVTEQDWQELEKARKVRDQMDGKHASAINVLRGEQGQRMRRRTIAQDKEAERLQSTHEAHSEALERRLLDELRYLDERAEGRKQRMQRRSQLRTRVQLKRLEAGDESLRRVRVPVVEWPDKQIGHDVPAEGERSESD
ncbi:hypothetical protein MBLNU230_g6731t1 [Neophaeotheca triangularis]